MAIVTIPVSAGTFNCFLKGHCQCQWKRTQDHKMSYTLEFYLRLIQERLLRQDWSKTDGTAPAAMATIMVLGFFPSP